MVDSVYMVCKIDACSLNEDALQEIYAAYNSNIEKYSLLKQFRTIEEYRDLYLSTFRDSNELYVTKENIVANEDALICGVLSFVKSADWAGKQRYDLTICLSNLIICDKLKQCLNKFITQKLIQHNQIAIITYNDELKELIEGHLSKVQLKANVYTLDKNHIDIDLLNDSITKYQAQNSNLRMVYTDIITEEYIDTWCNLFMETAVDMPDEKEEAFVRYVATPDKQRLTNESNAKRNMTHHCYMIFDADKMIGMTNMSVNGNDSRFPYQFMIGIKAKYRGLGLGKWLYAAMYKKLFEEVNFEKVSVKHHPENKGAMRVSEWIGYKYVFRETTYLVGE